MPSTYAAGTEVSIERSKNQIEAMLRARGAGVSARGGQTTGGTRDE